MENFFYVFIKASQNSRSTTRNKQIEEELDKENNMPYFEIFLLKCENDLV